MLFVWMDKDNGYVERKVVFGSSRYVGLKLNGHRPLSLYIAPKEFDTDLRMPVSSYLTKLQRALKPGGRIVIQ